MPGPQYLLCGSRLTSDTLVLRLLLEGLNTWARQWSETITIQDDGSLEGLEHEVEMFRHLQHRRVKGWSHPNVVLAFMDRLQQSRATHGTLEVAKSHGVPAFIISDPVGNIST